MKYVNVNMGAKVGEHYTAFPNHAGSAAGHLTVTYDDTVVLTKRAFKDALDAAWMTMQGSNLLPA